MLQSYRLRHFYFFFRRPFKVFFQTPNSNGRPGGTRVLGEETSNLDVEGIEPFSGWHQQPFGSLCCKTHGSRMLMSLVHVFFFWMKSYGLPFGHKKQTPPKRGEIFRRFLGGWWKINKIETFDITTTCGSKMWSRIPFKIQPLIWNKINLLRNTIVAELNGSMNLYWYSIDYRWIYQSNQQKCLILHDATKIGSRFFCESLPKMGSSKDK